MNRTICFDIDGTLCPEVNAFKKHLVKPYKNMVDLVNSYYDKGDTIVFYTARPWIQYDATKEWLDRYGFKYHYLVCGKPQYDILFDDKARQPIEIDKTYFVTSRQEKKCDEEKSYDEEEVLFGPIKKPYSEMTDAEKTAYLTRHYPV